MTGAIEFATPDKTKDGLEAYFCCLFFGDDVSFVFAGSDGLPFPSDAEEHFNAEFRKLQMDLFGV